MVVLFIPNSKNNRLSQARLEHLLLAGKCGRTWNEYSLKQKHFETLQRNVSRQPPTRSKHRAETWFGMTASTDCRLTFLNRTSSDFCLDFCLLAQARKENLFVFCVTVTAEDPDAIVHVQRPHYISQTGSGLATMMLFYGFAIMNLQRIKWSWQLAG